jgi:hypothetical protein
MKTYAIKCGQCESDQLVTEEDGDMRQLLDVHDHRVVIAPVHNACREANPERWSDQPIPPDESSPLIPS